MCCSLRSVRNEKNPPNRSENPNSCVGERFALVERWQAVHFFSVLIAKRISRRNSCCEFSSPNASMMSASVFLFNRSIIFLTFLASYFFCEA